MANEAILRLQAALKVHNCDPGEIDGIWGRRTAAAVMQFQRENNLTVDGMVGPETAKCLFAVAGSAAEAPPAMASLLVWFEEAKRLIGLKEIGGSESNPEILDWAADLDIAYPDDDIPWCGLFLAHCIGATLPGEPLPANPLGARNWRRFGEIRTPCLGAILVFWRGSPGGSLGHVGFYNGESDTAYQVLGGNQSNSVSLAWIAKDRLLDARWPITASTLLSRTIRQEPHGGLSTNEA